MDGRRPYDIATRQTATLCFNLFNPLQPTFQLCSVHLRQPSRDFRWTRGNRDSRRLPGQIRKQGERRIAINKKRAALSKGDFPRGSPETTRAASWPSCDLTRLPFAQEQLDPCNSHGSVSCFFYSDPMLFGYTGSQKKYLTPRHAI